MKRRVIMPELEINACGDQSSQYGISNEAGNAGGEKDDMRKW